MKTLGNYKILGKLGAGAMGEVYLAEHILLRVKRALKLLPMTLARSQGFKTRFLEEGRLLAALHHPNIVQVHDMDIEEDTHFIAMDFVSPYGQRALSLGDLIKKRGGRLPQGEVARVLQQVCLALDFAHGRGIIHRDIKPSNILVGPGGQIKVSDFGLAKMMAKSVGHGVSSGISDSFGTMGAMSQLPENGQLDDSLGFQSTMDGRDSSRAESLVGTLHFMPPEVQQGGEWTVQGDLYSLGVLAYVALVGKPPMGKWKKPSQTLAGVSTEWDNLLDSLLEEDLSIRRSTVGDLIEVLGPLATLRKNDGKKRSPNASSRLENAQNFPLPSRNIIRTFVESNKGCWEPKEWLDFIMRFYQIAFHESISNEDLERVAKEEKKQYMEKRRQEERNRQIEVEKMRVQQENQQREQEKQLRKLAKQRREKEKQRREEKKVLEDLEKERQLEQLKKKQESLRIKKEENYQLILENAQQLANQYSKFQDSRKELEKTGREVLANCAQYRKKMEQGLAFLSKQRRELDEPREITILVEDMEEARIKAAAKWKIPATDIGLSVVKMEARGFLGIGVQKTIYEAKDLQICERKRNMDAMLAKKTQEMKTKLKNATEFLQQTEKDIKQLECDEYKTLQQIHAILSVLNQRKVKNFIASLNRLCQHRKPDVTVFLPKGQSLVLVNIPAGFSFERKSGTNGRNSNNLVIIKNFWMGKYLVTQAQWESLMGTNPSRFKGADRPVENISWVDCLLFFKKLNKIAQGVFRLPSDVEWSYACQAGNEGGFCFGDDVTLLGDYAWFNNNSGMTTHPVGKKRPNAWGLHDMHGNVWEWCPNGSHLDSIGRETDESEKALPEARWLACGGSWNDFPKYCRSSVRYLAPPRKSNDIGFRIARNA